MLVFLDDSSKPKVTSKGKMFSVGIIIPCIYEGKEILKTVKNASSVDYKNKKVYLVLNKSSSKETIVYANYARKKYNSVVIEAPFNGKSKVMNYAIKKFVKEDIVLVLDADTQVEKNILNVILPYFYDKKVAAVVSSVKVTNYKDSIISWAQKYEYDLSILARNASSKINSLIIAHGAGSAFRRSTLKQIKYFDEDNVTEDLEIGIRLNINNYKVENDLNA
ncbi:MAG: glycosyltransferase family 2 protein, partial [Nitrososphaeria archaeon]